MGVKVNQMRNHGFWQNLYCHLRGPLKFQAFAEKEKSCLVLHFESAIHLYFFYNVLDTQQKYIYLFKGLGVLSLILTNKAFIKN